MAELPEEGVGRRRRWQVDREQVDKSASCCRVVLTAHPRPSTHAGTLSMRTPSPMVTPSYRPWRPEDFADVSSLEFKTSPLGSAVVQAP